MPAIDTSQETTVGRDWARSLVLLMVCCFVLTAFAYFMQTEASGHIDRRAKTASYVVVPLFAVFTPFVFFRLFVPFGPLLRISPDGFSDGRINANLVPWPEVRNIVVRSEFVTLTLSQRFARSYRMSLGQKMLKRHRKAGPSHLVVARWCLASTALGLEDLLKAYCTANGGRSSPPPRTQRQAVKGEPS